MSRVIKEGITDRAPQVLVREETVRGELVLRRREGADEQWIYEIISNGCFLMASTNELSARALADRALDLLQDKEDLRILVGGLGMGYTLRAVLERPGVSRVDMVEVEPLIVEWACAYFGELNDHAIADTRVRIIVEDLAHFLETACGPYDSILLDIDNGPAWLVFDENEVVYRRPALERMRELLAEGGVLGVWAAEHVPGFLEMLEQVFERADVVEVVEEMEGRPVDYFIYRGVKM